MKIAVVSNTDLRCGLGEHGRGVAKALREEFEVDEVTACPTSGYDVVIVNYLAGSVHFTVPEVQHLRAQGTKVIVILNDATPVHISGPADSLRAVDMVVAHEPVHVSGSDVRFRHIEIGMTQIWDLPEFDPATGPSVGTAGFPFPSKRMDVAVKMARNLAGRAVMVTPPHRFHEPSKLFDEWRAILGDKLTLITDWMEQDQVIRILSQCAMNVYYAQEDYSTGQSGSARMILAAGRPTIIRNCKKISPLSHFADEMYLVDSEDEAFSTAMKIWTNIQNNIPVKRPLKIKAATSWETVGQKYRDLVKEICQ